MPHSPTPPSPFERGPYTDPEPATEPSDGHGNHVLSVVKLVLLILFIVCGTNPGATPLAAGIIAGVLMFGVTVLLFRWIVRKIMEL